AHSSDGCGIPAAAPVRPCDRPRSFFPSGSFFRTDDLFVDRTEPQSGLREPGPIAQRCGDEFILRVHITVTTAHADEAPPRDLVIEVKAQVHREQFVLRVGAKTAVIIAVTRAVIAQPYADRNAPLPAAGFQKNAFVRKRSEIKIRPHFTDSQF